MAISASLLYIVIALVSVAVFFIKHKYSYWKRRGIPHDPPSFGYGNIKGLMKTRHFRDILKDYYDKYKGTGPFVGLYAYLHPVVLVLDLDLARNILIKDFHNFTDRGIYCNEQDDPLTGHLFSLDGAKWKHMRNKLSPTFTTGKMKFMFPTMVAVGDSLLKVFKKTVEKDSIVEVKNILARFTVDIIGTCAFGIDCNSLNDPSAEFAVMLGNASKKRRHALWVVGLILSFPKLAKKLGMRLINEDIHQFFMRVVRETVEYREKNQIKRNDFMNLLIELKNSDDGLTVEQIAAQTLIFFFAGFETSASTMGFALFELANNQDIQDKLRAEINEQLDKNDGKLTYESMGEMNYMEKVFKETLRKYPVLANLMRIASEDYPTNNPEYVIPKGVVVAIQNDAFQRDPDIYPDPVKFDPERFSPEEIQKRHPNAWLPFGEGPRNCIGLRFGKMEVYIGLTTLIRNFKFHYSDKTSNPLVMDQTNFMLATSEGIYLRVECIR